MAINKDPEELISKARAVSSRYNETKESFEEASEDRIATMKELHENQVSWAQIGRIFGISPQAAMYVTGHIKRTPAKGAAKKGGTKRGKKS